MKYNKAYLSFVGIFEDGDFFTGKVSCKTSQSDDKESFHVGEPFDEILDKIVFCSNGKWKPVNFEVSFATSTAKAKEAEAFFAS